ncbi:DUF2452 domain-containing protein [Portibacter marinus]|uniref:DUF2452 domain-containing protein n=1 Tax=Portibacter marinus TaxID=2898660 RepID=UPI001F35B7BA|nr:DUF2452 domain-containing protein [Portibacter marinus]
MEKNPIDKDKIAKNPHSLEYAHNVGSAVIKPIDKGRIKGLAVKAMYEQTDLQLSQIKEQIDLLAHQAPAIQDRVYISEKIYQAECRFKPLIGKTYHLYETGENQWLLSMIAPEEWKNCPHSFVNSAKLLADHTWDVVKE